MPTYEVTYTTKIHLTVTIDAPDEGTAEDTSWDRAEEYLKTIGGNYRDVRAEATLDGIGYSTITEAGQS